MARPLHPEEALKRQVLKFCKPLHVRTMSMRVARTKTGWRVPVEGDGVGWLDITMLGTRQMVRELKSEDGQLEPEQRDWLAHWTYLKVDVGVWRPADWDSQRIQRELEDIAPCRCGCTRRAHTAWDAPTEWWLYGADFRCVNHDECRRYTSVLAEVRRAA